MEPITIYAYPVTKSPFSLAECQEKLSPERLEQLSKFPEQSRQHSLPQSLPWRSVPAGTGCDACGQALLPCST